MSERIAYLVGNTLHRDHAQWPTLLRAELDAVRLIHYPGETLDQWYNFNATLAQIMALAWRVRKWKITGGFSALVHSSGISGSAEGSLSLTLSEDCFLDNPDDFEGAAELILINQAFPTGLINTGFQLDDNFDADFSTVSEGSPDAGNGPILIKANLFNPDVVYKHMIFDPATGLFSPYFHFESANFFTGAGGSVIIAGVTTSPGGGGEAAGNLTVDPLITAAFEVPLFMPEPHYNPGGFSTDSWTGSNTFLMQAVKFWPYKNSAGLPVYDQDTGAQLNDPFG